MPITVADHANAIARAEQALKDLELHPATTRSQLGAARDQLNIVRNWNSTIAVWDSVCAIEGLVLDVYGHAPR